MTAPIPALSPEEALSAWGITAPPLPCPDAGLINRTFLVGDPTQAVLQWVNPLFPAVIHEDIARLLARLESAGLPGTALLPRPGGALWLDDPAVGCWRLLRFVPGRTLHRFTRPAEAVAAGRLVGRFHAATDGWAPPRAAPVRRIHDTPARFSDLESALDAHSAHPLAPEVRPVAEALLGAWRTWDGLLGLPERQSHGDLKASNLRFHATADEGVCLLDLDTIGPLDISCELGDAWRSWCNPAGEDDPGAARFDLAIFAAAAQGFFETGPRLSRDERASLVPGVERICLELGARFAADALNNRYFREDTARFPTPGAHNLHRARAQLALARSVRAQRRDAESALPA